MSQRLKIRFFRATLSLFFLCTTAVYCGSSHAAEPAKHTTLQGALSRNELIDQLETMGIKCVIEQGAHDLLRVDSVRAGSSAYYQGVAKGDVVKSFLKSGADSFALTINRNGAVYQVQLKGLAPTLAAVATVKPGPVPVLDVTDPKKMPIPVLDVTQTKPPVLDVNEIKPPILDVSGNDKNEPPSKKLVKYNIELIIDISGSMKEPDGTGDISKFEWCHRQVRDLASKLAPYNKTVTITTFNEYFQTMENCAPSQVESIYASTMPAGWTNMVAPLTSRLNNALMKNTPEQSATLIAVITDGLPNVPSDPKVVNDALVSATYKMTRPDQLIVTFLQIGATFNGRDFCKDLDDNLVNEGAKYDIVDTQTFSQLQSNGLVNALIDAILEKKSVKGPSRNMRKSGGNAANNAAQKHLQDMQKTRKELEEQLLRQ